MDLNPLEEEILHKVGQRTPARMNEDTYLAKVFRHYDLSSSGFVDYGKFKQVMAPFASAVREADMQGIFDRYAYDGVLNYKVFIPDFVSGARRRPGAENEIGQEVYETFDDLLLRMKDYIFSLGPRGIMALVSAFRDADPDNQRVVSYDVFRQIMLEFFDGTPCPLGEEHVDQLFQSFRQPYTRGQVGYDDFLAALKEELSPPRREMVRKAFRTLDAHSEGLVDINLMLSAFNSNRHPLVSEGTRGALEVRDEFGETLRDLVMFRRGLRSYPTNLVAWEEFEDYYKFINGCHDSDHFFCTVMSKVWDLDKRDMAIEARGAIAAPVAGVPARSRSGLHHWQANTLPQSHTHRSPSTTVNLEQVLLRARRIIAQQGIRAAVDVVKNFYTADDDNDDFVDTFEFRRAVQQSALAFTPSEEARIFEACGERLPNGVMLLSVPKFLGMLQGSMSPGRVAAVERVWTSLGGDLVDDGSVVSPGVLKDRIACEMHPQVTRGEIDPAVILSEFLDTFSHLAYVRDGCQGGMVTFQDFLAYYEVVSSTIDNDHLFELLLQRLWTTPKEAWVEQDTHLGQQQYPASPRGRMAYEPPNSPRTSPMADPRPPLHRGPSAYNTRPLSPGREGFEAHQESHRRFTRKEPQVMSPGPGGGEPAMVMVPAATGFSPITKSSIVFDDAPTSEISEVCARIRYALSRRGLPGWKALVDRLEKYDNRRNGTIMRNDWERVCKSLGLGLASEDRELLFRKLSHSRRDGAMDYHALLRHMKTALPERRQGRVAALYDQLKDPRDGTVAVDELKSRFDARNTPHCMLGRKDHRDVQREHYEAIDYFGSEDNYSPEAFQDFFAMVSACHEDDHEFDLMTGPVFGLRPEMA